MYWVGDDCSKARQLDFSGNSFDSHARETSIGEGESVSGWLLFELGPDVRSKDYWVNEINVTVEDAVRNKETLSLIGGEQSEPAEQSVLSSGEWKFKEGYFDLSKDKYTMTPLTDLQEVLRRHREHPELYPPSPTPTR